MLNIHIAFLLSRGSLLALWCRYSAFYPEGCAVGTGHWSCMLDWPPNCSRNEEIIDNVPPRLAASQRTLRAWQVCGWLVFLLQNLGAEAALELWMGVPRMLDWPSGVGSWHDLGLVAMPKLESCRPATRSEADSP
jgi:hypothetical protein